VVELPGAVLDLVDVGEVKVGLAVLAGPEEGPEGVADSEPVGTLENGPLTVGWDGLREPDGPSGTLEEDSNGLKELDCPSGTLALGIGVPTIG
jgi:hypothetical protein